MRGTNKWRLLGTAKLTRSRIVPDYIGSWKFGGISEQELMMECEKEYGCDIVRNFENKSVFSKDYESIKQMGIWGHYSHDAIKGILTINLLQSIRKPIFDLYSEEEVKKNFWIHFCYSVATQRQQYFKDMPKVSRLKADIS